MKEKNDDEDENDEDDEEDCEERMDSDLQDREITHALAEAEDIAKVMEENDAVAAKFNFERLSCLSHHIHLVVDKTINSRMIVFGAILAKIRKIVIKYRMSPKARQILLPLFDKRLSGWVKTRYF